MIMLPLFPFFVYIYTNCFSHIMYNVAHEAPYMTNISDYYSTSCCCVYTYTAHGNGPGLENCHWDVVFVKKYFYIFIKHTSNLTNYRMLIGTEVICICLRPFILSEISTEISTWFMVIIPRFKRCAIFNILIFICKSNYGE